MSRSPAKHLPVLAIEVPAAFTSADCDSSDFSPSPRTQPCQRNRTLIPRQPELEQIDFHDQIRRIRVSGQQVRRLQGLFQRLAHDRRWLPGGERFHRALSSPAAAADFRGPINHVADPELRRKLASLAGTGSPTWTVMVFSGFGLGSSAKPGESTRKQR